ncbi:hypothetical protein F3Y22_tig00110610pilonHSYRG00014 [Hibiscus syriacus]|uniref:Uncharacterized protein n=1 Tax=Hibiscus syriacus TaxID=106335 RepID=A0A6A3A0H6_HIBSY|nr:hypothetical protein F3Y22_tig00110610pilonHSYRG00014 [Hibiscus syriacus]
MGLLKFPSIHLVIPQNPSTCAASARLSAFPPRICKLQYVFVLAFRFYNGLSLFFTEALFCCGVAVFLLLIDRQRRPTEPDSAAETLAPHLGQRISSVATLVSLIFPMVTMGLVWPWTGPAASATLAPYLVGIVVRFAFAVCKISEVAFMACHPDNLSMPWGYLHLVTLEFSHEVLPFHRPDYIARGTQFMFKLCCEFGTASVSESS